MGSLSGCAVPHHGRCLCHSKPCSFEAANRMILGNMADLMVREIWGAYEHAHRQRILQLVRACAGMLPAWPC